MEAVSQPASCRAMRQYNSNWSFNYSRLSYNLKLQGCSGQNLYFPIPYKKSCKVVADRGWGAFHAFNYTTYPQGTGLPTFSANLSVEAKAALAKVNAYYDEKLGADPAGPRKDEENVRGAAAIAAGAASQALRIEGARAITAIRGKLNSAKDREDQMAAMRQLTLEIRFDGQQEPAVSCTLGDFFGTSPGENCYNSFPHASTECPVGQSFGYSSAMRGPSQGRATCTMEPHSYGPAAPEVLQSFM